MTLRHFSIHAHFYQPPREDPLTGLIPIEGSAAPYPNWNERIYSECYRPNVALGNFEAISFNLGPTLCSWMQTQHPNTLNQIVASDQANLRRYGVGNAMAQSFHHTILPLASRLDKITQVSWGIQAFKHLFGRQPHGMWLPETAVDYGTLETLAEGGIQFTILAPWQAEDEQLDSSEPYVVNLPNGKQITVFFYQRDLSASVSFDSQTTINADSFAKRHLLPLFDPGKIARGESQLLLVASDGELYGHHQQHRERFLSRLVNGAASQIELQPTFPALWLKSHPPHRAIDILECTSWSCHHGVRRWMGACPCASNGAAWKAHLRFALECLADKLDGLYLETTASLVDDPWELRDRYIHVLLGSMTLEELLAESRQKTLTSAETQRAFQMLEAQRYRQRMFTSCGWFFDDFGRIEPLNNVGYAAQALHIAHRASGVDLEAETLLDLERVVCPSTGMRADSVFQSHLRRVEENQ